LRKRILKENSEETVEKGFAAMDEHREMKISK
jgi:hypothetical protein